MNNKYKLASFCQVNFEMIYDYYKKYVTPDNHLGIYWSNCLPEIDGPVVYHDSRNKNKEVMCFDYGLTKEDFYEIIMNNLNQEHRFKKIEERKKRKSFFNLKIFNRK